MLVKKVSSKGIVADKKVSQLILEADLSGLKLREKLSREGVIAFRNDASSTAIAVLLALHEDRKSNDFLKRCGLSFSKNSIEIELVEGETIEQFIERTNNIPFIPPKAERETNDISNIDKLIKYIDKLVKDKKTTPIELEKFEKIKRLLQK